MNEIYWIGDRFHCNDEKLEIAHQLVLESQLNAKRICEQMQRLGFDLDTICLDIYPRKPFPEGLSFYPKGLSFDKDGFTMKDQGIGFNICLNLIGYAIATRNSDMELRIYSGSFQQALHPLLYKTLRGSFDQTRLSNVYKDCLYSTNSAYLKCTVNPMVSCNKCEESPQWFKDSRFEWIEISDWRHILKYREVRDTTRF